MFTWLQNMMQKHHKWLFSILLVVIIVAFVFTIGNTGGVGSPSRGDFRQEFYGFDLNSPQQTEALSIWTSVSLELHGQRAGQEEMQAAVMQRAVLLYLADQFGVPDPDERTLARYVRGLPAFQDPQTGRFSNDRYTQTLDFYAMNPRLGEETLTAVILQDYRIDQVRDNLRGPGYTLPEQAKLELQGRNTQWSLQIATLDRDLFTYTIDPDEAALEAFFEDNDFRYEVPPAMEVSYVEFPAETFVDRVGEPTEAQLKNHYQGNQERWGEKEQTDNDGPKAFEDVKEDVQASWKREEAGKKAVETANHFSVEAYEAHYSGDLQKEPESVRAFLDQHGKRPQKVRPFHREQIPADAELPRNALRQAAGLTERRFYSDGVGTPDGAVVFFFEREQPAYIPPFENVRDQVARDYRRTEERRLYNEKAAEIREKLQTAVTEGESFAGTAEELGLSVRGYEPFTFMDPPRDLDFFVMSALRDLNEGDVSELLQGGDRDKFVYLESKTVPTYETDGEDVRNTIADLRSFSSRATGQSILNELMMVGQQKLERREF